MARRPTPRDGLRGPTPSARNVGVDDDSCVELGDGDDNPDTADGLRDGPDEHLVAEMTAGEDDPTPDDEHLVGGLTDLARLDDPADGDAEDLAALALSAAGLVGDREPIATSDDDGDDPADEGDRGGVEEEVDDDEADDVVAVEPRRPGEFLCASCFLIQHRHNEAAPGLCRDCV